MKGLKRYKLLVIKKSPRAVMYLHGTIVSNTVLAYLKVAQRGDLKFSP